MSGLTKLEREEIILESQEMMLEGRSYRRTVKAIMEIHFLKRRRAETLVNKAAEGIMETVKAALPTRRLMQLAQLERLYEDAKRDKAYSSAVSTQRLIARVAGTERPYRHVVEAPPAMPTQEDTALDGRTNEELVYYLEHGYFQDAAPVGEEPDEPPEVAPADDGDKFPLDMH